MDWVERVLTPIGWGAYIWSEVRLPPLPNGEMWSKAWAHVEEADRQLRLANDPGVFSSCRAALEGLSANPKQIMAFMSDGPKKSALDELLIRLTE
jgi:hypothetical protein